MADNTNVHNNALQYSKIKAHLLVIILVFLLGQIVPGQPPSKKTGVRKKVRHKAISTIEMNGRGYMGNGTRYLITVVAYRE